MILQVVLDLPATFQCDCLASTSKIDGIPLMVTHLASIQCILAHRLMRQDSIDQQGCTFCHSLGATTWAKSSTFATKSNVTLVVTTLATYSQKPMRQNPALQVLFKFILNILGQHAILLCKMLHKRWIMRRMGDMF